MKAEIGNTLNSIIESCMPEETYSIGVFCGGSPFEMRSITQIANPIISRRNFPDAEVNFVADPFAVFHNDMWFLFYEVMMVGSRRGKIFVSRSRDLIEWDIGVMVLEEEFHLSYPHIVKENGDYYMVPETFECGEIRLYKCMEFPNKWKFQNVMLPMSCVDSTLIKKDNTWYLFTCDRPHSHDRLRLFYSEKLSGDWLEHPASPLYEDDPKRSRPAGKIIETEGRYFRFAQVCRPFYGHSVNAFEITLLNTQEYKEAEVHSNPVFKGCGSGWNGVSMHHVDMHFTKSNLWTAFVDGRRN